ncbi:uncharacterized protein LOC142166804 isoform X1 [Nicotiana tabacum]|uniref:Uncharacterized protein LOC142166804 isoform X1 n=1 Tax=Nicotiana tabacum TaxID=4097 RepID=A0AC58SBD2_TOBAC
MERSDSVQRARTDSQYEPPGTTTPTAEAIAGKLTYGTTVSTATATPTTPRDSVIARQTTHNGMSAMIFKAKDYYEIMAEECKLTIAGRFLKLRPQIERLRSSFRELFSIKGAAKIGVNDNYNIFIDFNNEDDFNSIWYGRVIEIEGLQMWLQKWSLDIKPDEDIPIVLDDTLTGTDSSVDIATKENMDKLVKIGKTLLKKPVSRVNLQTGLSEQCKNGGTNEETLKSLRRYFQKKKDSGIPSHLIQTKPQSSTSFVWSTQEIIVFI